LRRPRWARASSALWLTLRGLESHTTLNPGTGILLTDEEAIRGPKRTETTVCDRPTDGLVLTPRQVGYLLHGEVWAHHTEVPVKTPRPIRGRQRTVDGVDVLGGWTEARADLAG
jgi:hypothetical protein